MTRASSTPLVFSLNTAADHQARVLLRRLCEDGPELANADNQESAQLLERLRCAEFVAGGSQIRVTDRGRAENDTRATRRR